LEENKEVRKETRKRIAEMGDVAKTASGQLASIKTLEKMLPDFYQGPLGGPLHTAGAFVGNQSSQAAKTFDAIVKEQFTIARAKMLGSNPTDNDVILLQEINPSSDKRETTNRNIFNSYKAVAERQIIKDKAAKEWLKAGGNLDDFDTRWNEYSNAFPLLQKNEDKTLSINEDNLHNWQIIFEPEFENMIGAYQPITQTKKESERNVEAAPGAPQNDPHAHMTDEQKLQRLQELKAIKARGGQ
jgi:hypothetical protein